MRYPNCKCLICAKEIYRRPFQLIEGNVFCSIKCSSTHTKIDVHCIVCHKSIQRRSARKGAAVTCSRACANKNRTGIKYGIGQPNNKASKQQRLKEVLLKFREPKCNRCTFDKIEILHIHHIVERTNGGTDEHSNLELLCPNCHSLHHYINRTQMER